MPGMWLSRTLAISRSRYWSRLTAGNPELVLEEVQVRQAQLALEKKVEVTNQIAVETRALSRAALDVAESNYGYYSVLGSTRLLGMEGLAVMQFESREGIDRRDRRRR